MFNEYPYVNLQDVNLDWILKHIKDLENNLQDFVKLNTIKYANPIIWNITTQYETNTVVIDGNTGTAYLSVQPVPTGVGLTNTDYWTPIFTLNLLTANQNITFRDDGTNVIASFASDTGDWLLWNFYLYKVTQPISVNTAYVEGFNIERFSVELFIKDYINALDAIIGDLDDLNTSDKTSIVEAINSLLSDISNIIGDLDDLATSKKTSIVEAINSLLSDISDKIGDLDDLATSDKTSIVKAINSLLSDISDKIGDLDDLNTDDKTSVVNAINELVVKVDDTFFIDPAFYGAVGDGITDDTLALQTTLNHGNVILDGTKTYLISDVLNVPSNRWIYGNDGTLKIADTGIDGYEAAMDSALLLVKNANNVKIENVNFDLNGQARGVYSDYSLISNVGILIDQSGDVTVSECSFINAYTNCVMGHQTSGTITIKDNYFKHIYQEQGLRKECIGFVTNSGFINVTNNFIDEDDIAPQYGIAGIGFANCNNVNCSFNKVINCGRSNLYAHPLSSITLYDSCDNVLIEKNYINSVESFIRMDASRNVIVKGNVCIFNKPNSGSDSDYIRVSYTSNDLLDWWGNITIEENEIYIKATNSGAASPIGLTNDRPTKASRDYFIRNNKIVTVSALSIHVANNIKRLWIEGNTIECTVTGGASPIYIDGSGNDWVKIINNQLLGASIIVRHTGSSSIDNLDYLIAGNFVRGVTSESLSLQNLGNCQVHDNEIMVRSFYSNNANTGGIFVHDNNMHDVSDTNAYVGTSCIQHNNYLNTVLVASFA